MIRLATFAGLRAVQGCVPRQPVTVDRGVLDSRSRADAAHIGGMDRQTLRNWVHRLIAAGPDGPVDQWSSGPPLRLSLEQQAALAAIVEKGPERTVDGVVRWRRADLKHVINESFGVDYDTGYVGKLLHRLRFSRQVEKGAHAVLIMGRAGWHTTANLSMPKNITPIFVPSRVPELNPVENVWQYLRQNWLSNRVFHSYDTIVDASSEACRNYSPLPKPSPQLECASGRMAVKPNGSWY